MAAQLLKAGDGEDGVSYERTRAMKSVRRGKRIARRRRSMSRRHRVQPRVLLICGRAAVRGIVAGSFS